MNKQEYFHDLIEKETSTKQRLFYSAIYLFSQKGFSNVGIRELCRSVNVKESAFYNHYRSKDELFEQILRHYEDRSSRFVFTDEEIRASVDAGDIRAFLVQNMRKFSDAASDRLYHTIRQIVMMESYVHPGAKLIAGRNLYYTRREYTERVLEGMRERGTIKACDVRAVTAEYYYALMGLLDEYLLQEIWDETIEPINRRIAEHIDFFAELLRKD